MSKHPGKNLGKFLHPSKKKKQVATTAPPPKPGGISPLSPQRTVGVPK